MFNSNLVDLKQQRANKVASMQDIIDRAEKAEGGPRATTEEENTLFDRLQNEVKALDANISSAEAYLHRREEAKKLSDELQASATRITTAATPASPVDRPVALSYRIPAECRRVGTLKAFKPRAGERADEAEMRAFRAGNWLLAQIFGNERAIDRCSQLGIRVFRNAMGTTSNPDGGILVADELADAIIVLRETYGVFRKIVRVWPMASDTKIIPRRSGGVTIGAIGENPSAAITQSNPTFNSVQLIAKKAGGLCLLSNEIRDDSVIDLADWVASEFAYGFANFEDQCGFTGDGSSTYLGIKGWTQLFPTTLAGSVQCASTHDTFVEVDNTDLTTLMGKLPQYARPNAKWYCSATAADLVFSRLAATAGGNNVMTLRDGVIQNMAEMTAGSYLGYPIVISQLLPSSTGTINLTPMLFFGDASKCSSMGDRNEVRIFASADRYMDTDQFAIRGTERFDAVTHDIGDTSTAGPLVCLLGKT